MFKYTMQRLLALAITLFIVLSLSFVTLRMMPGSFIEDKKMLPDIRRAIENKYHLHDPLIVQYGYFLKDFSKFDFGVSVAIQPKVAVNTILKYKIPVSMQVNILSLIFTIPIGVVFGIIAALKKNKFTDHAISTVVMLFISVPSFVFAAILQYFVAFKWDLLPILVSTDKYLNLNKLVSMILPILALSFGGIAVLTRYMRSELCEALNSEYMLLAKAKGLNQVQATIRHAIRNSFIPLVQIIIPMFIGILGGSLVIEKLFSIPGMGNVMVDAINSHDDPVTMGVMFWFTLISLGTVLIVDLSYGIIDPRIRMGGKK